MRQYLTRRRAGLLLLGLLAIGLWSFWPSQKPEHHDHSPHSVLSVPDGRHSSYTTNFALAENPISEGKKWISGKAVGLDWSDVATQPGLAYGTESGEGTHSKAFDDAVALLTGPWGPDQTVVATVHTVSQDSRVFEEVELRLRSSLSARSSTGYEILFRCLKTSEAYASIVRWDGPLGKFAYLTQKYGPQYGVSDGDIIKAEVSGNVITAYVNGVELMRATDDTYSSGSPGMGFWLRRPSGISTWFRVGKDDNISYGFTELAAWDSSRESKIGQQTQ